MSLCNSYYVCTLLFNVANWSGITLTNPLKNTLKMYSGAANDIWPYAHMHRMFIYHVIHAIFIT